MTPCDVCRKPLHHNCRGAYCRACSYRCNVCNARYPKTTGSSYACPDCQHAIGRMRSVHGNDMGRPGRATDELIELRKAQLAAGLPLTGGPVPDPEPAPVVARELKTHWRVA